MSLIRNTGRSLLLGWILLGMTACMGDDQLAGIEGTGDTASATGSVTGFGSVFVNGTRYDTADADIQINGSRATEAALATGMVVSIESAEVDGVTVAESVTYDRSLYGPIVTVEDLDATRKQLRMLGQTVIVGEDAVFEAAQFDDLAVGMVISVSALSTTDGTHLATRVAQSADASLDQMWELEGSIHTLNQIQATLQLGNMRIDYADALFTAGNQQDLVNGVRIEVKGELPSSGPLQATEIRFLPPLVDTSFGETVSFEGLVTSFQSITSFRVSGIEVDGSSATAERGNLAQLQAGSHITVAGRVNTAGTVVADSIALIQPNETRLRGSVASVNSASSQLRVLNTVFKTDAHTVYEDQSSTADRQIGLGRFNSGETVEVFGSSHNGQWIATRITRIDASDSVAIKGPATNIASNSLSVLGITVNIPSAETSKLVGLQPGTFVTVDGEMFGSNAMNATELQVHSQPPCTGLVKVGCSRD